MANVMTPTAFKRSVKNPRSPAGLTPALRALWWAKKDNWARAHKIVMDDDGRDSAWVHAHLHRVEGDASNARYWYREAGRPAAKAAPAAEWNAIVKALIEK
jgi:hypothetical protein